MLMPLEDAIEFLKEEGSGAIICDTSPDTAYELNEEGEIHVGEGWREPTEEEKQAPWWWCPF